MIVKLSNAEQATLSALDPKGKGPRPWLTAREVGGGAFKKEPEDLEQAEIRVVRNAFRKIVREGLVEMSSTNRGQYRITDTGRKLLSSNRTEFDGMFERGEATKAAKAAGEERRKSRPRLIKKGTKTATKKKAAKKGTKTATKKKAAKKTTKKTTRRSKAVTVVDKTDEGVQTQGSNGSNGEHRKPRFKRREALRYANSQASGE